MAMECTWTVLKQLITNYNLPIQWADLDNLYFIRAKSGTIDAECYLQKNGSADQTDFETNYKNNPAVNQKYLQVDSDGAGFSRVKQAPTGWTFQLRGFEFATSTYGSLINNDQNNLPLTDATLSFYDSSGNLLTTSTTVSSSAVKTVLEIEPPYDYYIIGGEIKILAQPTTDVILSVVAVPDIPASSGGSKAMAQNINLKYVGPNDHVKADGRASKLLTYDATLHTNKLQLNIFHAAGEVHNICLFTEVYK